MRFLILYSKGDQWMEQIALHNQLSIPEHAVYVQEHFDVGMVVLAGAFGDETGGAVLIDVASKNELHTFIQNDPAVISGVFSYEFKEWGKKMSKFEGISPGFDQGYVDYKHEIQRELKLTE
ncbi:YciI family protein [Jeotgalibacillus aurantiacus]|uniref:YciI family protein n=1 Tax=Jeotgalibacillus aurantiacus TaxID=2763266 RepID=UPI001D09EC1A|nr:YciI family protein [Jeotgalibacillus aurantiacus]